MANVADTAAESVERVPDLTEPERDQAATRPDLTGLNLAIIGSRGYPSTYGGFETLVRRLAPYLLECGASVTVYGRQPDRGVAIVDGVTTITTLGIDRRSTSTLTFGATSALDAVRRRPDAALVLNVANGFWLPFLARAGVPTAVNVDGLEWERGKWNGLGKRVFWYGAKVTARRADVVVCDARAIADTWRTTFGVDGVFIPYGADVVTDVGSDRLERLRLEPGGYVLMVSRVVPENNIDIFLDAVQGLDGDTRAVFVGSAHGPSPIEDRLQRMHDAGQILWLGHVADQTLLGQLWANCAAYFHGHSAGGTNPALLQAMGFGAPTIVFDTRFNREVVGDGAVLVADAAELVTAFSADLEDPEAREIRRERQRARVQARYTWGSVNERYSGLLGDLAARR